MRFSKIIVSFFLGVVTAEITAPTCQTSSLNQTMLNGVRTAYTNTTATGYPFGLVYAAQPGIAFVSLDSLSENRSSTLGVLDTRSFPPVLLRQIRLDGSRLNTTGAFGVALSNNGKYLFVAAGSGAFVVDTEKAVEGCPDPVVGILASKSNITEPSGIEVTLSINNKYAFISQEYGSKYDGNRGTIDVFKLNYSHGNVTGEEVGYVELGGSVVGSALSPDGKYLYVTSEVVGSINHTSAGVAPQGSGVLSVLDVETLKTDPSKSQIRNVTAGCQPVREIVSSDGSVVWVTARASNHLVGFNASALIHNPKNALIASVEVGTSPVGLIFAKNESRIIIADSDRFGTSGAHSALSVVDVAAALDGSKNAVLGQIETGLFPREFALSHDGKILLVGDFQSNQVQAIDLSTVP